MAPREGTLRGCVWDRDKGNMMSLTDARHRYPRHSTPTDIATIEVERANYVQPATRQWEPLKARKAHARQAEMDAYRAIKSAG